LLWGSIKINLQDPELNNKETELVDYSALFDHDEIVDENGNYNANFNPTLSQLTQISSNRTNGWVSYVSISPNYNS
jgi:hypothetical protein